jgi:hypothetical protein
VVALGSPGYFSFRFLPLVVLREMLGLIRNPAVRGLSSLGMHNATVSLNSLHQPPHLSRAQTHYFDRLLLTNLFLRGLINQVESLDLARFHPQ